MVNDELGYHGNEIGWWTSVHCECEFCPLGGEHREFIPVKLGPITKRDYEQQKMWHNIYAPMLKAQLEAPLLLQKLQERGQTNEGGTDDEPPGTTVCYPVV